MRKIIMDVDTGTDDAIAIMAAALAPELELVALCSVHGNTSVENTTRNTLRAAFAAGNDTTPVYPGMAGPLVKTLDPLRAQTVPEPVLKGESIIEGKKVAMNPDLLPLPDPPRAPEHMSAVLFYVNFLRSAQEKYVIVATGALSNLAMAMILAPDISANIEEVVIMGGGIEKTNITAAAEANFFKDPEAAAIVLRCGARITICTLDATHSCSLDATHEARIRAIGSTAAIFTANDIRARRESYNRHQPLERFDTAPIHDALCIAWLLDPSVAVKSCKAACDVDCSSGISEGRLQVDRRCFHRPANVTLVTRADPDRFCDILANCFLGKEQAECR